MVENIFCSLFFGLVLYVLKLVDNKYYIGTTNNFTKRLEDHYCKIGSEWTKKYQVLSVELTIDEGVDRFDEDKWTKYYMSQYGIDNVRGGSYTTIHLKPYQIESLRHELRMVKSQCFLCGSQDHFAAFCPQNRLAEGMQQQQRSTQKWISNIPTSKVQKNIICYRCGRYGHIASNCYAKKYKDDIRASTIVNNPMRTRQKQGVTASWTGKKNLLRCRRCGYAGHTASNCFAKTHIDGHSLLPTKASSQYQQNMKSSQSSASYTKRQRKPVTTTSSVKKTTSSISNRPTSVKATKGKTTTTITTTNKKYSNMQQAVSSRRGVYYCYRCGSTTHLASNCNARLNPKARPLSPRRK